MLSVDSSNQQATIRLKLCPRHLFLQTHKRALVPANTKEHQLGAQGIFGLVCCKEQITDEQCPVDLFNKADASKLNY